LVALYAPLVWHWCTRDGLPEQDRADAVQDVFGAVAAHLHQFHRQPGGTFRGWLRVITRNKVCDLHRRRRDEPAGAGGSEARRRFSQVPQPAEDEGSGRDGCRLVRRALELLRPEFAERTWLAFWRTAVEGRDAAEAAAELGMTPGAVRVAKCR